MNKMSHTGRRLRESNEEIIKYLNQLKEQRDELVFLIEKQKAEKASLHSEMARISYKLSLIEKSLAQRQHAMKLYDDTLTEIHSKYKGLADSTQGLLTKVRTDTNNLETSFDKKIGTEGVCRACPDCEIDTPDIKCDVTRPSMEVEKRKTLDNGNPIINRSDEPVSITDKALYSRTMEYPMLLSHIMQDSPNTSALTGIGFSRDMSQIPEEPDQSQTLDDSVLITEDSSKTSKTYSIESDGMDHRPSRESQRNSSDEPLRNERISIPISEDLDFDSHMGIGETAQNARLESSQVTSEDGARQDIPILLKKSTVSFEHNVGHEKADSTDTSTNVSTKTEPIILAEQDSTKEITADIPQITEDIPQITEDIPENIVTEPETSDIEYTPVTDEDEDRPRMLSISKEVRTSIIYSQLAKTIKKSVVTWMNRPPYSPSYPSSSTEYETLTASDTETISTELNIIDNNVDDKTESVETELDKTNISDESQLEDHVDDYKTESPPLDEVVEDKEKLPTYDPVQVEPQQKAISEDEEESQVTDSKPELEAIVKDKEDSQERPAVKHEPKSQRKNTSEDERSSEESLHRDEYRVLTSPEDDDDRIFVEEINGDSSECIWKDNSKIKRKSTFKRISQIETLDNESEHSTNSSTEDAKKSTVSVKQTSSRNVQLYNKHSVTKLPSKALLYIDEELTRQIAMLNEDPTYVPELKLSTTSTDAGRRRLFGTQVKVVYNERKRSGPKYGVTRVSSSTQRDDSPLSSGSKRRRKSSGSQDSEEDDSDSDSEDQKPSLLEKKKKKFMKASSDTRIDDDDTDSDDPGNDKADFRKYGFKDSEPNRYLRRSDSDESTRLEPTREIKKKYLKKDKMPSDSNDSDLFYRPEENVPRTSLYQYKSYGSESRLGSYVGSESEKKNKVWHKFQMTENSDESNEDITQNKK